MARITGVRSREYVDRQRDFIHASRDAGLDTSLLVELYDAPRELKGDARYAEVLALFVGGERGLRIGAERARRMISESEEFARLSTTSFAPWLFGEVEDDDE